MRHVKCTGGIRQPVLCEHSQHGGQASLQRKLHLRLVAVPWRQRHGLHVAVQQEGAEATNLNRRERKTVLQAA